MPNLIHMSVLQRLSHFLTTHCKSLQHVYVLLHAHASLNFPLSLNFAHLTFSHVLSVCVSMSLLSREGPERVLQYVAVCCSMLQYVTVCCSMMHIGCNNSSASLLFLSRVCCRVLQLVAVICSMVQCVAKRLQGEGCHSAVAEPSMLQCVAVCCRETAAGAVPVCCCRTLAAF